MLKRHNKHKLIQVKLKITNKKKHKYKKQNKTQRTNKQKVYKQEQ